MMESALIFLVSLLTLRTNLGLSEQVGQNIIIISFVFIIAEFVVMFGLGGGGLMNLGGKVYQKKVTKKLTFHILFFPQRFQYYPR